MPSLARGSAEGADQEAYKSTPILVALGGFNSCKSVPTDDSIEVKFEQAIFDYRLQVANNVKRLPKVVRGCFVNSLTEGSNYYFSGLGKNVMSLQIAEGFFDESGAQTREYTNLIRALTYAVLAQTKKVPNPIVFIAGHSHGAWLAAQVAAQLATRGIRLGAMITMDPISPLSCNPGDYLNLVLLGVPAPGCVMAPPDWSATFARNLNANLSDGWYNFYQTQFPLLHSSEVAGLPHRQNLELFYDHEDSMRPAHTKIDDDIRAWGVLAALTIHAIDQFEDANGRPQEGPR